MPNLFSKIISTFMAIFLIIISFLGIVLSNRIDNVILLIGDGMGFMSIEKTKSETGKTLTMDSFEIKSQSQTASASSSVTDSAAGATALACGVRTNNGCVGVYPDDIYAQNSYPMNLCEFAKSKGMLTGIVTTDKTRGATPAGFSVHTNSRDNSNDITNQQIKSGINLIWGVATSTCSKSAVENAGYEYVTDYASMSALKEGSSSFGQFTGELWHSDCGNMPTLSQMTSKAIDLLDDGDNGFFLMVEGAHIDKNNHSNNGEGMKEALLSFDEAVKAALDYAKADKHTLVVVTADHETGGITLENGEYVYTTTGHTGADVPVLVYGYDDFIKDGETSVMNTDIPKRIVEALKEEGFPQTIAA
ncbi:MAG: alkaline phosphatase [Acutalibacteraceae bacterium]